MLNKVIQMVDRIIWEDPYGFIIQHGAHTFTRFLPDDHASKSYCRYLLELVFRYNKVVYFDEDTKTLYCDKKWVGWWIGKKGVRIRNIEKYCGWKINIVPMNIWYGDTYELEVARGLFGDCVILTRKKYIEKWFLLPDEEYEMFRNIMRGLSELYDVCSSSLSGKVDELYFDVKRRIKEIAMSDLPKDKKYKEILELLTESLSHTAR